MKFVIASIAFAAAAACAAPVLAQGQGGYSPGVPGADTAAMSGSAKAHARRHHATNDTSGGTSSIDKSGKTQEGGRAMDGAQGSEQSLGAHAAGNSGGSKTSPTR